MILYSTSLKNRIAATIERAIGSNCTLIFYSGPMPETADEPATGDKISHRDVIGPALRFFARGQEPDPPTPDSYWRLLDNGGLVVMQGDGRLDE